MKLVSWYVLGFRNCACKGFETFYIHVCTYEPLYEKNYTFCLANSECRNQPIHPQYIHILLFYFSGGIKFSELSKEQGKQ